MWSFYKEKKYLLISLLVIVLDGIIVYFIPCFFNKLNYFYPMLTISLIPFLFKNNKKKYFSLIIILGFIYDILYTNIILYNVILFLLLALLDQKIIKYFSNNIIIYIILVILNIVIYDSFTFALVIITSYQDIVINDLFYKIVHSLLLNIMSVFVYYFIFNKRRLKHTM